jgi:hypothetical protein
LVVHADGLLHSFEHRDGFDRADPFTPTPERVQLVACARYEGRGTLLKVCRYESPVEAGREISHHAGRYEVRVLEARTGRLLGTPPHGRTHLGRLHTVRPTRRGHRGARPAR